MACVPVYPDPRRRPVGDQSPARARRAGGGPALRGPPHLRAAADRGLVTEDRTHRLCSVACQGKMAGVPPEGIAGSAFGPGLRAAVVTMTARNRVSRRDMSELARELFRIGLSVGAGQTDARATRPRLVGSSVLRGAGFDCRSACQRLAYYASTSVAEARRSAGWHPGASTRASTRSSCRFRAGAPARWARSKWSSDSAQALTRRVR